MWRPNIQHLQLIWAKNFFECLIQYTSIMLSSAWRVSFHCDIARDAIKKCIKQGESVKITQHSLLIFHVSFLERNFWCELLYYTVTVAILLQKPKFYCQLLERPVLNRRGLIGKEHESSNLGRRWTFLHRPTLSFLPGLEIFKGI